MAAATTGRRAYNVTPLTAGPTSHKIDCFCFNEQTLKPGETQEMPVVFFVDPAIDEDRDNDGVKDHHPVLYLLPVRKRAEAGGASEPDRRGQAC